MSAPIRLLVLCGALFLGLAPQTAPALADPPPPPPSLDDKLLISIPPEHLQPVKLDGKPASGGYAIFIAANRSTAAYIARKDGKHFVVVGSEKGPDLEGEISGLRLSADGKTVIYILRTADRRIPYVNHKPLTDDGASVKNVAMRDLFLFSPDGSRLAAVMELRDKEYVILDGQRSPDYPIRTIYIPVFSRDSKRFAYNILNVGAYAVVVDGTPQPTAGGPERAVFSPDSAHVAYAAGGQIILDGKLFAKADGANSLTFSPDGKSLAFVAKAGQKNVVIFNGKQGPPLDTVFGGDGLFISPDSKRIAYTAKQDGKNVVVVDDQISPPFDFASEFRFSPDSKRFAYKARLGDVLKGKELLIDNGERSTEYDKIAPGSIVFSPDSTTLACSATTAGKSFIVINGKKQPEYEGLLYNPVYSPDGSKLAYSVNIQKPGESRGFVVINDQPGPDFDGVSSPVFSPDSKHVAYAAAKAGKQFIALDHQPGPETGAAQSATFTPDGKKLTYQSILGREIWWKVMDVP